MIGARFALNISQAQKYFLTHPMELLGDMGCLESRFDPFGDGVCNTPGVCHSLSSGFELKHDRLSGDDNVKINLWR
jgi:hypothetical protein